MADAASIATRRANHLCIATCWEYIGILSRSRSVSLSHRVSFTDVKDQFNSEI